MSVTVRTNRATNPSVTVDTTGWLPVSGTGGVANHSRQSGAGFDGVGGFLQVIWTTATTAVSGGARFSTGSVLTGSTQYTHSVWVKASKVQRVALTVQHRTSGGVNTGSLTTGTHVVLVANTWTRLTVTATSPADGVQAFVDAVAVVGTSGVNWAVNDTLHADCLLIETGAVLNDYFDGSYADASGVDYAWTGTANASSSTATTYAPVLTLLHKSDAPCDRVEVTITDLIPSTNTVTLWRTADGVRRSVRGFRRVDVIGSDFIEDYEVPLGRLVTYELEVLAGTGTGGASAGASITVSATGGWIQDPLDPGSAVRLLADDPTESGEPTLKHEALKSLEMPAQVNLVQVIGSRDPVALLSDRMTQAGLSFSMMTDAAQAGTNLRNLIMQSPLLLIRPLPEWSGALPGLCYTAAPKPVELPKNEAWGGTLIEWQFETGLIAPPTMKVVIPTFTYQDWQDLWSTYQQAQTALAGDTYLQVKKSPTGA